MNIQSNINQAISIAGFIAGQTPFAEGRRQKKVLEQQDIQHGKALEREKADLENIYKGAHTAAEAAKTGPKGRPTTIRNRIDPLAREIEAGRKLQEKFPSAELEQELLGKEDILAGYRKREEERITNQQLEQDRLAKSKALQDIIQKGGATTPEEKTTINENKGTLDIDKLKGGQ